MRQFTDAEKQLLEAKIKDEQERQNQAVKEIARRKEEASKRAASPVLQFMVRFPGKYDFLGFIFCLLVFNAIFILIWRDQLSGQYTHPLYAGLVVTLMLLFDHIAYFIFPSRVMKTVAWSWTVLGGAYVVWFLRVQIV